VRTQTIHAEGDGFAHRPEHAGDVRLCVLKVCRGGGGAARCTPRYAHCEDLPL
jgi:hypothetical protein